jgi:hypothetical protein
MAIKYTKMEIKIPHGYEEHQMFSSPSKIPQIGFLICNYTIWQTWTLKESEMKSTHMHTYVHMYVHMYTYPQVKSYTFSAVFKNKVTVRQWIISNLGFAVF